MHNMIIEDEGRAICPTFIPDPDPPRTPASMEKRLENSDSVRSREIHNALKEDLVQHLWIYRPLPVENGDQNEGNNENDDEDNDDDGEDDENDEEDDDEEGEDEEEDEDEDDNNDE